MTVYREFDEADAFTTGAVGLPGARTFFLQVGDAAEVLTIKCEKEQVMALAAYLRKALEDAPAVDGRNAEVGDIVEPHNAAFVLGSIGLAYDRSDDRVILQFEEVTPEDQPDFDASRVRIRISRAQASGFCERAEQLVNAGRPPCYFCGLPMNRDGHACPRMN
jgi:uncharacterized repeat protein (TIGR03847 family)